MATIPDWFDLKEVERLRTRTWTLTTWRTSDAWRPLDNPRMWTNRKPDDTTGWERVPGGWDHEHCRLCSDRIWETSDPATSLAYFDGVDWLCRVCHDLICAP